MSYFALNMRQYVFCWLALMIVLHTQCSTMLVKSHKKLEEIVKALTEWQKDSQIKQNPNKSNFILSDSNVGNYF